MNNKVAVILTTYNGATRGFLEIAIESVLKQTFQNYELLIVDDGSEDETRELCERYISNPRIRYIYQENSGLSRARNAGIESTDCMFICFLDDDDVCRWYSLSGKQSRNAAPPQYDQYRGEIDTLETQLLANDR